MTNPVRKLCGQSYTLRRGGGRPRTFCTSRCRAAYHEAARRYVERMLAEGKLSLDDLRVFAPSERANEADPEVAAQPEIGALEPVGRP